MISQNLPTLKTAKVKQAFLYSKGNKFKMEKLLSATYEMKYKFQREGEMEYL